MGQCWELNWSEAGGRWHVLVQMTCKVGRFLIIGAVIGKCAPMFDYRGRPVIEALLPPGEVLGLEECPQAR